MTKRAKAKTTGQAAGPAQGQELQDWFPGDDPLQEEHDKQLVGLSDQQLDGLMVAIRN
jgi:hypothetical protein